MDVVSRVRVSGPLAEYAAGFAAYLAGTGYTPLPAANQVRLLARLGRWLEDRGLAAGELTGQRVQEFLAVRRAAGYTCRLSERGLAPLLGFLRGLGAVPEPGRAAPAGAAEVLLDRYRAYLEAERGLAASTVRYCTDEARGFLAGREDRLAGLDAAEVSGFVAAGCRRRSTGSAKILVTALRSLLRFLVLEGLVTPGLQDAVPAVAGWRGGGLPRALPDGQVAALLAACDRDTATGRRDYAVLVLLSRLGLRACEAAALELDDIDWRAGTVTVRGKGRRDEQLPLPPDAGEALAGCLRDGRRAGGASRRVFLASRAPGGGMSADAVKAVVRNACRRAGLPEAGAHRLRHSAATGMLRAGAPLAETGQVLRHRSASTTAIYAKVGHGALAQLEGYLALRRGLGFRLERPAQILEGFAGYLGQAGAATVTTGNALAWATAPAGADPAWWRARLAAIRPFARYLSPGVPGTGVPPRGLLPGPSSRRAAPCLYSDEEAAALMAAAAAIRTPFRAVTCQVLTGLLAATGMRAGGAVGLDRDDLDAGQGLLTIRSGKSRQLPLHPCVLEALAGYARLRDSVHRRPAGPALLLSATGTRLICKNVHFTFHELVKAAGLRPRSAACRPRIHDLRHAFAVTMLTRWHAGGGAAARLPLLSAWLGHAVPDGTYWYLTGTPELLALAAGRLAGNGGDQR